MIPLVNTDVPIRTIKTFNPVILRSAEIAEQEQAPLFQGTSGCKQEIAEIRRETPD